MLDIHEYSDIAAFYYDIMLSSDRCATDIFTNLWCMQLHDYNLMQTGDAKWQQCANIGPAVIANADLS